MKKNPSNVRDLKDLSKAGNVMSKDKNTSPIVNKEEQYLKEISKQVQHTNVMLGLFTFIMFFRTMSETVTVIRVVLHWLFVQ